MQKILLFIFLILSQKKELKSQILTISPTISIPFIGINNNIKNINKYEFNEKHMKLSFAVLGFTVSKQTKKAHSNNFFFEWAKLGTSFKISNQLLSNVNNTIGEFEYIGSFAKDFILVGYYYQLNSDFKSINLNKRVRNKICLGLSYGFNRSQKLYDETQNRYFNEESMNQNSFLKISGETFKSKNGLFIESSAGLEFLNKKNKAKLKIILLARIGLKTMSITKLNYKTGFFNPYRSIERKTELISNGTSFGIRFEFPIKLKL